MTKLKGRRVESPSSINTYKQCPRKYFYQYIEKLPGSTSIHLIRGSVVHSVLEDFYDIEIDETTNFRHLHMRALSLFTKYWKKNKVKLDGLGLTQDELQFFFDESVMMIQNWFNRFKNKMNARMEEERETFAQAFVKLTPIREEEYRSEAFMVRGFVDLIHEIDGKTIVLDYKTSKKDDMTEPYRLQLAIYAMLYEEKHGKKPDYVGIDFLKSIEKLLPVDDELVQHAKFELEQIHASTVSNEMADYQQRPSPLCKWRSGQCDFYDTCFGNVSIEEFKKRKKR